MMPVSGRGEGSVLVVLFALPVFLCLHSIFLLDLSIPIRPWYLSTPSNQHGIPPPLEPNTYSDPL